MKSRTRTRHYIALILASHLTKQNPCELSQKEILDALEKTVELKVSRNTLARHISALKLDGYIDYHFQGKPPVTVYKMTDKLLSYFGKEYQKAMELEQMIIANDQETEAEIQIKKKYQPLKKPDASGFYCIAATGPR